MRQLPARGPAQEHGADVWDPPVSCVSLLLGLLWGISLRGYRPTGWWAIPVGVCDCVREFHLPLLRGPGPPEHSSFFARWRTTAAARTPELAVGQAVLGLHPRRILAHS
jgi:hypothetical protein